MRISFLIAIVGILVASTLAEAKKIRLIPAEDPAISVVRIPHSHDHHPTVRPRQAPRMTWEIPAGKFGLLLKDGTRIIGVPARNWAAKINTSFGIVNIPIARIHHVAASGKSGVSIHLKNGDRVSGKLIAQTMRFETEFGALAVPATDIERLSSVNMTLGESNVASTPISRPTNIGRPFTGGGGPAPRIIIDSFTRPR